MGPLSSKKKKKKESKNSSKIDEKMKKEEQEKQFAKLLLLGAGESGKSTVIKQMKIIHKDGFDENERKEVVDQMFVNTHLCMTNIIKAMEKLGIDFETEKNRDLAVELINAHPKDFLNFYEKIKTLWKDGGIQDTYSRRNEFQLFDAAEFYFTNIDRFVEEGFVPNDEDILNTRVRTTGIIETKFEYEGIKFSLFDVGGQRNERKKWIHCFSGVTVVIFCASLSEYDQNLFEDSTKNRMTEALMLFEEICNSRWFTDTSICLFLNKADLFRKKIKTVDLNVCFKDYEGGCDFDNASEYLKEKFLSLNRNPDKDVTVHFTCATDTENMQHSFDAVKDAILRRNVKDVGMI
ncbi:guanine nucleotide-binding protein g(o) subunit alpha [Anaeramoeba flamelloides]|uniref:Guanine nucleotide-binding protein g(O) subunit alpha n=1 Tax=Anaeramoeba flamelloides TaxID=1746091 RepID=A0ABQ8XGT1_9EUKA|nr:guanine nucleotide-binding protein g(o) subunit alpha [Anaeramoeba flamelloides]